MTANQKNGHKGQNVHVPSLEAQILHYVDYLI